MKKAIIFVLSVSCMSGSAPQAKKLMPRRYNAEATQKLQEQMTSILKLLNDMKTAMHKVQASSLSEIESLIKDKADPNTKAHIKTAFGGEQDISLFEFLLAIILSVEESNLPLLKDIIKTALQHGMNMVIEPNRAYTFIRDMRMLTGDSPDAIREILNAVENPQQKEQSLNAVNKVLNDLIAQEKEQIQSIKNETDKVRKILEALESKQSAMPIRVNIK